MSASECSTEFKCVNMTLLEAVNCPVNLFCTVKNLLDCQNPLVNTKSTLTPGALQALGKDQQPGKLEFWR